MLNHSDQRSFAQILGEIFEHSPWIPRETWEKRPFHTIENLHHDLRETLEAADEGQKLELIRAHPDLAGKLAISGELTDFSTAEQQSAKLNKLTAEQFETISKLNQAYKNKFKFPFIICVKDHTQSSIFKHFEERVNNDAETELNAALKQISRIAWHRLNDLLT
ncbi:MAG: 2-oxo-4-hydroxy-4-carboxy-5-ureidoimidazoline decarboxylase [Verrucomicrobia bacterium]|nr:2-oxo-4-hydroxy-4-carboxy-5-ureidoimidazoline decarboxylase [Verrucomicrobiota bacterium]MDA1065718.1 2-oxo-4-hydroxy-4-carboxy-5-ureidoimidazoline decarboxylase [Verrucomicrobiota bacterium]